MTLKITTKCQVPVRKNLESVKIQVNYIVKLKFLPFFDLHSFQGQVFPTRRALTSFPSITKRSDQILLSPEKKNLFWKKINLKNR